jgi:hypothetical protein
VILAVTLATLGAELTACNENDADAAAAPDAATTHAVQRLALDSLFTSREHHRRIVLWATDAADGPVLEVLGTAVVRPVQPRAIDVARLAPALPARVMSERELTTLFRRNPDAWAAFFRENPGAAGLVELSPVRLSPDGQAAETIVGRSCGEHCRNAWRLRAQHGSAGWHIDALQWLPIPDR